MLFDFFDLTVILLPYIRNYEKIKRVYKQQFDIMQRMNQKWLDLFPKSWEQHQNEKR